MKNFLLLILIIFIFMFFMFLSPKQGLCLEKGQLYNMEAQNIANTSDLVIKAEHAYYQRFGGFADIAGLEQNNPAYLSPIPLYGFNDEACIKKILFKANVYICVNLQENALQVFVPDRIASMDIAADEISKGITGKIQQFSYLNGYGALYFDLKDNPPSFASNPDTVSKVASTLTSPNANGEISYVNTNMQNRSSLLSKTIKAVENFFAAILSLF